MKRIYLILVIAFFYQFISAQDFVYKPQNPAFGGDSYNYTWLLSSAESQNKLKDPALKEGYETDPLLDFQEDLNRQILYNLSRQLVQDQFGEETIEPGTYDVGSYHIEVTDGADGLNVSIIDAGTGSQTSVIIPHN